VNRVVGAVLALVLLGGGALLAVRHGSGGTDPTPTPAATASATSKPRPSASPPRAVTNRFFGVHDADPVGPGWPRTKVGSLRVWDAGVAWNQIETSPGQFNFSRLDAIVATARSHDADVLLVLGQTPKFYASKPKVLGAYGLGATSMPKLAAWKTYVRAVAERYKSRGVTLQVWNEANVVNYWSGSQAQMAQLTKAAHDVVQGIRPRPTLVAPAMVTRLAGQRRWLDAFYGQRVGGRPVADFLDIVSLQLYPMADGRPEDSIVLLKTDRALLARHRVTKPIWNTEVNYGLLGGKAVTLLPEDQQAAQVARTYLLNAANGIGRVYWYAWDTQKIVNTRMVTSDHVTLTSAGQAFGVVVDWMGAAKVTCSTDAAGTYACVLAEAGKTRRVYWNPKRRVSVTTDASATSVSTLDGATSRIAGGAVLQVGGSPVLVRGGG